MGQGDKKLLAAPSYKSVRCDVTGKEFAPCTIRSCPHPSVIEKYGLGGKANVSVWVCRKCRYHVDHKWHGGVGCSYGTTEL